MTMASLSEEEAQALILQHTAVIFDNDGTLVDTMPVHFFAWVSALREHSLTFSEAQFYSMAGMTAAAIIAQLCCEQGVAPSSAPLPSVLAARERALAGALQRVRPVAVVRRLLDFARANDKRIAVASGGERADVVASLTGAGYNWEEQFETLVTTEDVTCGKPHPETFLTAAKRLGVSPEECVGLEDGDRGLEALDNAGMAKIDVRRLNGYPLPDYYRNKKMEKR